ncbi:MAG: C40 family peptidase [Saprospiraceae bacterium]|nr:C40 family peptidase [Saprospiraceae bacterium]
MALTLMITSCSPSTTHRTGKYSSANKRASSKNTSKEDKRYTYEKSSKSESKSTVKVKSSSLRDLIVSTAMQYEGIQYRSGGKTPETGFDCSGFTGYIFTQNGIPLSGPSHKLAERGQHKLKKELLPGDLVFFGNEERISHVAIVSDNTGDLLKVVHATTSAGVKVDEISSSDYWTSRFLFGVDVISK